MTNTEKTMIKQLGLINEEIDTLEADKLVLVKKYVDALHAERCNQGMIREANLYDLLKWIFGCITLGCLVGLVLILATFMALELVGGYPLTSWH